MAFIVWEVGFLQHRAIAKERKFKPIYKCIIIIILSSNLDSLLNFTSLLSNLPVFVARYQQQVLVLDPK